MKKINFKKIKENKRGFTLLFAILVAVMVLAVGTSIINISLKQVILSGSGRESQFAFYAANTGMECALFWDLNGTKLNAAGQAEYVFPPPGAEDLLRTDTEYFTCGNTNIINGNSSNSYTEDRWQTSDNGQVSTKVFKIEVSHTVPGVDIIEYCAQVTVEKKYIDDAGSIQTTITSQGLNTCDPENNPRAVQRGLELQYRS
jgi:Tfp pilus assembly protein PilX